MVKRTLPEIEIRNQFGEVVYIPLDGRLIMQSRQESVDGVAFVSGTLGRIATTFTAEELNPMTGKSYPKRVCGFAEFVTPRDISRWWEIPKLRLF